MNERRTSWRCRRLLRSLDVRPPLDVTELCRRLGNHRGRELRLMPWALAIPGPFGIWIETDDFDAIVYQKNTSKSHQDHIILHEVGHIVAGHGGDSTEQEEAEVIPAIPTDSTQRRLRRTCYEAQNEREAELVASIIGEGMGLLHAAPAQPRRGHSEDVARVDSSMTFQIGWWK